MEAEQVELYGDVPLLEHMEAEAANEDQPNGAGDAYDDLKEREKNGGASLQFDPAVAEICTSYIGIGFGVMEKRNGAHWALADEECRRLGIATAQVIYYYFPESNLGPLANLTVVSATILGPRMLLDLMIKREKQEQQRRALAQKKNDSQGGPDDQPDQ